MNLNENLGKVFSRNEIPEKSYIFASETDERLRLTGIYDDKGIFVPENAMYFEPQLKEMLGVSQKLSVATYFDKTCGAVLFTRIDGIPHFLIVKNRDSGHIGYPKGHIELGETEIETAVREVFEETGLRFRFVPGYRIEYSFLTKDGIEKHPVYYLGEYDYTEAKIQAEELAQSWLLPYEKAMELLNYEQDKRVLSTAYEKIKSEG